MKTGKSPGKDKTAGEIIKLEGLLTVNYLYEIIKDIREIEKIPQGFKRCKHNYTIQK